MLGGFTFHFPQVDFYSLLFFFCGGGSGVWLFNSNTRSFYMRKVSLIDK